MIIQFLRTFGAVCEIAFIIGIIIVPFAPRGEDPTDPTLPFFKEHRIIAWIFGLMCICGFITFMVHLLLHGTNF